VPKLTKPQLEVIDLLRSGWGIGLSTTMDSRVWIQKGGAGRGGESRTLRHPTFAALCKAGLVVIDGKRDFPTTRYKLADDYQSKMPDTGKAPTKE
jgi:hypothetical protein